MTTLVVAHDAGGAEILSSWARRQGDEDLRYVLAGPAVAIFERKVERILTGKDVPRGIDFVLCGSSASEKLETRLTRWALRSGIPCAVWLDHWKNYRQRLDLLPDEVWVTDRWAADLAKRELDLTAERVMAAESRMWAAPSVRVKGNPYLEDVVKEIRMLRYPRTEIENVLYVHEPGRRNEFKRWMRHGFRNGQHLHERPHPAMGEAERTLAEDVAWADTVVGCDSMALVVALKAGRQVVSVLPKKEELTIPYPGIERLYD